MENTLLLNWSKVTLKLSNNVHKWYCNTTVACKEHGF